MRNIITGACLIVVVAVSSSAAQTPTPQPVVKNQANIDALKKKVDEKQAQVKAKAEAREAAERDLSLPTERRLDRQDTDLELRPGLEGAQDLFGFLFSCFGSPVHCGIYIYDDAPRSDPYVQPLRLQYFERLNKELEQLTLEYDKIVSEFVAAGGKFEGASMLRFSPDSLPRSRTDEEKRLEAEYRAEELKRREEAKNKTKNEPPPPPPPPPPISSIPQTPAWDIAASYGVGSSVLSLNEPGAAGTSSGGHAMRNTAIAGTAIGLTTLAITAFSGNGGAEGVAVTPPVQTVPPTNPFVSLDGTYPNIPFVLQPGSCAGFNPQFTGTLTVTGHSSDNATAIVRIIEAITREYRGVFRNRIYEGTGSGTFASGRTWAGQVSFSMADGSVRNVREVLNVGPSATSPACPATYAQP